MHVNCVGKKFCRDLKKSLWYGIKDITSELIPGSMDLERHAALRPKEFWAVDEISFELRRGECLGLIGRNGAGKTTLLKMLNGLIKPDKGRIEIRGRVGALISLGAGFNPILTGRENIYVNAAVLGLNKEEINDRYDDIVEFSELKEFIESPVRSYSSGMKVRLGFAIASSLDPDVLLLDEVLAVGDAAFRDKCYHRIADLRRKAAVIFVSHSMEQIARTSSHVLTMHRGLVSHLGDVETGIHCYENTGASKDIKDNKDGFLSVYPPVVSFSATLDKDEVNTGSQIEVHLEVTSERALSNFLIKVLFYNARGAFAADGCIRSTDAEVSISEGFNRLHVLVDSLPLKNGIYTVAINLIDEIGDMIVWSYKLHKVRVTGAYVGGIADCQLRVQVNEY